MDTTSPIVIEESYTYKPSILNYLTFGIFGNNTIDIAIKVKDNDDGCGVNKEKVCLHWGKKEIKRLNETEQEILLLSARGYTVEEIAKQICKSVNTIKTTKRNLFKRFETESIMNTWVDIMNRRQI